MNPCCLTWQDCNINANTFRVAVLPYCEMRQRNQWCYGQQECQDDIDTIIRRADKYKPRNFSAYLMKSLQESLAEIADASLKRRRKSRRQSQPEQIGDIIGEQAP